MLHIGLDLKTEKAIMSILKAAQTEALAGVDVDADKVKADAWKMLKAGVTFTPPGINFGRTKGFTLMLNPDTEYSPIRAAAKSVGKSESEWAREALVAAALRC